MGRITVCIELQDYRGANGIMWEHREELEDGADLRLWAVAWANMAIYLKGPKTNYYFYVWSCGEEENPSTVGSFWAKDTDTGTTMTLWDGSCF